MNRVTALLFVVFYWVPFIAHAGTFGLSRSFPPPEQLGHTSGISVAAWSPDGRLIASGSGEDETVDEHSLRIWDALSGEQRHVLNGHVGKLTDLVWSPNGRFLLSKSVSRSVSLHKLVYNLRVWNIESAVEIFNFPLDTDYTVNTAVWSADGNLLIIPENDGSLKIWNADSGREAGALAGHTGAVGAAVWSPDGRFIVSGIGQIYGVIKDDSYTLKIWDAATGMEIRTLNRDFRLGRVTTIAWLPDGQSFLTYDDPWSDVNLTIWELDSGAVRFSMQNFSKSGVLSADGSFIADCFNLSDKCSLSLFDTASTNRTSYQSVAPPARVAGVSPSGRFIVLNHDHAFFGVNTATVNTATVWDIEAGAVAHTLMGHTWNTAWSPNERFIVFRKKNDSRNVLRLWDMDNAMETLTLGYNHAIADLALSPDGSRIVSASNTDAALKIWDALNGTETHTLTGHSAPLTAAVWSPDGRFIASGDAAGILKIWDAETMTEHRTLNAHKNPVYALTWSPDGRFIASGSGYYQTFFLFASPQQGTTGEIKVWDTDGVEQAALNSGWVSALAWSPDGRFIASGEQRQVIDRDSYVIEERGVRVRDALSGAPVLFSSGNVTSVAWSPDSRYIVYGTEPSSLSSKSNTLIVWDTETDTIRYTGAVHISETGYRYPVTTVVWSPDGRFIAAGANNYLKVFEAESGMELRTFAGHTEQVSAAAWSPDGRYLYSGSADRTIKAWDTSELPAGGQCAVYNPAAAPQVTLPCVTVNGTPYRAGLNLAAASNGAMRFDVDMSTLQTAPGLTPGYNCAVFPVTFSPYTVDASPNGLRVNCVQVGTNSLWAELDIVSDAPPGTVRFELRNFGEK